MALSQIALKSRLHGKCVLLSAGIPDHKEDSGFERVPDAATQIEEAVISIARAVFIEGGTLVFAWNPSIAPLIACVVESYHLPAPAEKLHSDFRHDKEHFEWRNPSVRVFQSEIWKRQMKQEAERLARNPLFQIHWTKPAPARRGKAKQEQSTKEQQSMDSMRREMIQATSPVAMVVIGGTQNSMEEAKVFHKLRPNQNIFALATTGGAAARLPKENPEQNTISVADTEALELVRSFWKQQEDERDRASSDKDIRRAADKTPERKFFVPYAYVAHQIVARLVDSN
jgi:hypothetical protein